MLRQLVLAIAALLVATTVLPNASAHSVTGAYTIASTPVVGVVCSPDCLGVPDANIGGYRFPATGEVPASVSIQDDAGGVVSFVVCQDLNADNLCGGEGEPRVDGCGNSATLPPTFRANQITSVFVHMRSNTCTEGVGTSGIITLTYAI